MNLRQSIEILPIEAPNADWLRLRRLLYLDDSIEQLETEMQRMIDGPY